MTVAPQIRKNLITGEVHLWNEGPSEGFIEKVLISVCGEARALMGDTVSANDENELKPCCKK